MYKYNKVISVKNIQMTTSSLMFAIFNIYFSNKTIKNYKKNWHI